MTIPTNPRLTKLRILAEQSKLKLENERKIFLKINDTQERAWLEYVQACRSFGYCASCEKLLQECECVIIG